MRKKIFGIVLIIFLLFPIKFHIKDGGSYGYESCTYKVTIWNGLADKKRKTKGLTIEALHLFEIYNSFRVEE